MGRCSPVRTTLLQVLRLGSPVELLDWLKACLVVRQLITGLLCTAGWAEESSCCCFLFMATQGGGVVSGKLVMAAARRLRVT